MRKPGQLAVSAKGCEVVREQVRIQCAQLATQLHRAVPDQQAVQQRVAFGGSMVGCGWRWYEAAVTRFHQQQPGRKIGDVQRWIQATEVLPALRA